MATKLKKFMKESAVRLIRKAYGLALERPETYDQSSFPTVRFSDVCESSYCMAGFIVYAKSPKKFRELCDLATSSGVFVNWANEAAEALGLPERDTELPEGVSQKYLSWFGNSYDWPYKFAKMYRSAGALKTLKGRDNRRAKALVARWEDLIAHDGRDPVI